MSLYEEFTGETCPPCAATNPGLNALLSSPTNASKIIAIKWQVPIPSAPANSWSLYKTNQAEIDWRYRGTASSGYGYPSQNNSSSSISSGINSAPSGRIDGQHQWAFGASSDHPANLTSNVISTAQSYTSAFTVTMNRAWDHSCSAVIVTVNIVATAPFSSTGTLRFRTVMVEREIHFATQPGTNGEKDFEDVAIKSFPTLQSGVSMAPTWTVGQSQTFTLNCPIPSYVRSKEQIAMVGFIQDDGNRRIEQAVRADKVVLPSDAASLISPVVDVTCDNQIHPFVTVTNESQANSITNMTLTPYLDGVAGNPTIWNGSIAAGMSSQIAFDAITTSTVNGQHTFSCTMQMNVPNYNLTNNATKVNYMVASVFNTSMPVEEFMYGIYPPPNWMVVNVDGGPSWSRATTAGNNSMESSKYDFYNNAVAGDRDELYLPPLDLSAAVNPYITFDVAYAQKDPINNDALDVLGSYDCGISWNLLYTKAGTDLSTVPAFNFPGWVPTPDDATNWRNEAVPLTGMNKPNLLLKFATTADGGNNLYIDNVNIISDYVGLPKNKISQELFTVYPNPASSHVTIKTALANTGKAQLQVLNTLGQVVYSKEINGTSTSQNITDLNVQNFATGIYNVMLISGNGVSVKKLNVVK